jgi:carbon-monoxide dehydrogenase large subunit
MSKNGSVGIAKQRVDAMAKVTGAAKYVDDIQFPGTLQALLLRSPHAHAEIVAIDLEKAKALPGVKAVICGKDYPVHSGIYHRDQYMFAMDRVRYAGEPVAAVAAETLEIARKALSLIKVKYKKLKSNFDPIEGLKKDSVKIHPELHNYFHVGAINPVPHTNIANHFKVRKGNSEQGFEKADVIIENHFKVPQIQHVPMETHGVIAVTGLDNKTTVWSSCQSPFTVRNLLSHCFSRDLTDFRVIAPYVGGGFGCKAGMNIEHFAVALSMECRGKPVKLIMTREEETYAIVVRQACNARIKTGLTRDGKIVAQENEYIWDCGAYAGYGVNIVRAAGYSICGPYNIENLTGDSIGVYTNRPVGSAFRGFGMSEIHWAIEQHMDMIAEQLNMDPLELRKINCLKEGGTNATGQKVTANFGNIPKCIDETVDAIDFNKKREPFRATGIALAQKAPAMPNNATSGAIVKMNEAGGAEVLFSGMEIGQGVMTVMAQIAAETLGVDYEKIHAVGLPDTDYSPYEWQTVASRITFSCGNAVKKAAEDALHQLKIVAAEALETTPEDLKPENNGLVSIKNPAKRLEYPEICMGYQFPDGHTIGGAVVGRGLFTAADCINCDPETGYSPKPVANWTFGAQAVDLSVCPDTGKITIHKITCAYDVGKVINPQTIDGQAFGGIIQGMGAGIMEQIVLDEKTGIVRNPSFTDYLIPTSMDSPVDMEARWVETAQVDGPYGARGIGEHTMIPTPAAIANAVYKATGVRIKELPVTPEKILTGLKKLQSS